MSAGKILQSIFCSRTHTHTLVVKGGIRTHAHVENSCVNKIIVIQPHSRTRVSYQVTVDSCFSFHYNIRVDFPFNFNETRDLYTRTTWTLPNLYFSLINFLKGF